MRRLHNTAALFLLTLIYAVPAFSQYHGPRDDPIIIQIIELDHADAEELVKVLEPFLSQDGRITAYGPGNILIIKDRRSIVRDLVKVLKGKLTNDQ